MKNRYHLYYQTINTTGDWNKQQYTQEIKYKQIMWHINIHEEERMLEILEIPYTKVPVKDEVL